MKISEYSSRDEKCGEETIASSIVQRAPGRSDVERRFEVTRLEMEWGFPPEIPPSAKETSLCATSGRTGPSFALRFSLKCETSNYMRSPDPPYFCGGAKNNVAVNSNRASSDDETVSG